MVRLFTDRSYGALIAVDCSFATDRSRLWRSGIDFEPGIACPDILAGSTCLLNYYAKNYGNNILL